MNKYYKLRNILFISVSNEDVESYLNYFDNIKVKEEE